MVSIKTLRIHKRFMEQLTTCDYELPINILHIPYGVTVSKLDLSNGVILPYRILKSGKSYIKAFFRGSDYDNSIKVFIPERNSWQSVNVDMDMLFEKINEIDTSIRSNRKFETKFKKMKGEYYG